MLPSKRRAARNVMSGWQAAAIAALALCFSSGQVSADDASAFFAPPPAVYKKTLAKLMTPVEDVLKKDFNHGPQDGVVLLDETITHVGDNGQRTSVFHSVDKALNSAGVKALAQDTFSFKKKFQRLYLVSAETIQPDGTRNPVKPDAVFLKTPQDQTDDSVYNDENEMVIVYSNVKPGSVTESVIVLEDLETKIPGQYSQTFSWSGSWPECMQRLVVDLPQSYADRLKVTNLGQSVPAPTTTTPAPQRKLMTWEKLNTPGGQIQAGQAPSLQIGPLVWLSTLSDWDAFAAWYNSGLKGTDKLSPELTSKIDEWTKGVKDPEEILRILYAHAAQDVRYTAFELGKSDLQPHDCMSVWDRQYGDCKDKANLLRAMLAYKNVPSWLVLLDTEHSGAINKANPDYRQFDHCILDAQIGDKTVICDPTITYGVPGLLGGSETDRDVLVIKGDKAEWLHTPPFRNAAASYSFDMKLSPAGELSGWMELKADGYYGASYRMSFKDLTREQIQSSLQNDVRSMFPNANVVDVEPAKDTPSADRNAPPSFSIRAFMVLNGVINQGGTSSELKFPAPDILLPDVSDYKTRDHATFEWPDRQVLTAKIQLPPGWNASSLPIPFTYDSHGANLQASWSVGKDVLTAQCLTTVKQSLYPPDEMRTLGDAITNLRSWASKSISLVKSNNAPVVPVTPQTDQALAASLPVMPTGEGQLNLIDTQFPSGGNVAARRAALERIATLFPSDKKAIVEAAIKLAAIDLDDQKWTEVVSRLRGAIEANRAALDPDTIAWAEYVIGCGLIGQEKMEEARNIFKKIAEDNSVDSGRRGWAIFKVAKILADASSAVPALDYADKGLNLDSDAVPVLYSLYASVAVSSNQGDRLKDRLKKLIASKPEDLSDTLIGVADTAQDLIGGGHKKEALDLIGLLESISDPTTTGDAFARELKKVRAGADSLAIYAKVQEDLKKAVAESPEIAALEKKQPQFASIGDAEKSESQHEDSSESEEALGCALRLAIGYPADEKFSAYFWNCVNYTEWSMRNAPAAYKDAFFFKLTAIGDELPHGADAYTDTKLLLAKVDENMGRRDDASKVYDALTKATDLSDGFQGAISLRSGINREMQGDFVKALACYQTAEKFLDDDSKAREALLRGAFIQFDQGNKAESLRLVRLLADAAQKNKIKTSEQVHDVIALLQGATDGPPAYWENWHAWWPLWQKIETEAGLDPVRAKAVPIIPNMLDLGKELGTAKNDKDVKRFFELMRQVAYASRFYPNAALEFTGTFPVAEEVMPDRADMLRHLAIAILEPFVPTNDKDRQSRILNLLVNYVDTNQDDKALDLMEQDWKPELEDGSVAASGVHRVWGIAASRKHRDIDQVKAALEKDIAAAPGANTAITAGVLSDVDLALGLPQDAEHMLEAELANPAVAADRDSRQDLKMRLDNMLNESEATKLLADGVAVWLKEHKPDWWDFAEPKSPEDPRLARLDEILNNPESEFQPAELVKAGLLAPSVPILGAETQEQAVRKAFTTLLKTNGTQTGADALAKSILDNPSFPPSLKSGFLFEFLLDAYENRQTASFEAFAQGPVFQSLTPAQKNLADRARPFLKMNLGSSSVISGYVQNMVKHPLDQLDLGFIQDAVSILLLSGDIPAAQAIYQASSAYSFAPTAGKSKPEFQLILLKQIHFAQHVKPIIDALRQATLAAHKPETITKPGGFDQRRNKNSFGDLTEAEATSYRLYLVKQHLEPLNLQFWYEFMQDQPHTEAGANLVLSLLKAGLDSSAEDDVKSSLVEFAPNVLDVDNVSVRQHFLDLVQPYRDPVKYPHTMENIRMFDVALALRVGKPVNLETDLAGFNNPLNAHEADYLKIRACLQMKDVSKLKLVLNDLTAEQVMSPTLLKHTVPALEAAGMSDEAALARDTLDRKLYQDVLAAWFSPSGDRLGPVVGDMEGLGSAKAIPEDFTVFTESHIARQQPEMAYKLFKDYADRNWGAASSLGTSYTQAYPTFYTSYWPLGRSLAELGKKEEAIKALTVYCQYSRDEIWYPEAKALLEKLSGESK